MTIHVERKTNAAWTFWQESQQALDELNGLMQQLAVVVSSDSSIYPPPALVRDVKRNLADFQEKFTLLVREQKRKADR